MALPPVEPGPYEPLAQSHSEGRSAPDAYGVDGGRHV